MKALIDPTHIVSYVSGWQKFQDKYYPVYTEILNSARVCQIEPDDQIFAVSEPEFWESCSAEIIPDVYYFDMVNKEFILVPQPAPYPNQPVTQGAQTI
jgi:hypothetical protein